MEISESLIELSIFDSEITINAGFDIFNISLHSSVFCCKLFTGFSLTFWSAVVKILVTNLSFSDFMLGVERRHCHIETFYSETFKYCVGVQWGQSYLRGRSCLFNLGWQPFWWWCHDKNTLWGSCFTLTSFATHLFLLGWSKLNLVLLDGSCWLVLMLILFWLSQTWPVTLRIQE